MPERLSKVKYTNIWSVEDFDNRAIYTCANLLLNSFKNLHSSTSLVPKKDTTTVCTRLYEMANCHTIVDSPGICFENVRTSEC